MRAVAAPSVDDTLDAYVYPESGVGWKVAEGSFNFDAEIDAKALRAAMKGMGTNEDAIIKVIGIRTNAQRMTIRKAYSEKVDRDLMSDFKSELTGSLERLVMALFRTPAEHDAFVLEGAMKGAGTDEAVLTEILCTRSPAEIAAINTSFEFQFKKNLVQSIRSECSGHLENLLVALIKNPRDPSETVNLDVAKKDANLLFTAGEGQWGTDEQQFIEIFTYRNWRQLRYTW